MKLQTLHEARHTGKLPIKKVDFQELAHISRENEGLVLLGAGGDLNEWVDGITDMLHEQEIAVSSNPSQVWDGAYVTETTGGRTDLVLMFGTDTLKIGKLAMWRLAFGDASWLSDYVVNYRDQH